MHGYARPGDRNLDLGCHQTHRQSPNQFELKVIDSSLAAETKKKRKEKRAAQQITSSSPKFLIRRYLSVRMSSEASNTYGST
jgi:hypothetical protein